MDSYHRQEVIINVLGLDQIKGIVKASEMYHEDDLKIPKTMYQMALDYAKEDNSDEDVEDEDGNVIKEKDDDSSSEEEESEYSQGDGDIWALVDHNMSDPSIGFSSNEDTVLSG